MTDEHPPRAPLDPTARGEIVEALENLIPRSLDDIVRLNRHLFRIGLATSGELAARAAKIEPSDVKDTIDAWRMLSFRFAIKSESAFRTTHLSLLGWAAGMQCVWITSAVRRIDVESGLVQTGNSLYRLGVMGEGEPPLEELITLCAALHSWGLGRLVGAPEFYF